MRDQITHYPLAIALILLGALSMALMGVCVKLLGPEFHWSETLFFRFLLSFIFFCLFLSKDKTFTFKLHQPKWLIWRLIGGIGSMVLYFYVLHYTNLANATLLVMSAPLYVAILARLFLNVRTNWVVWVGIIITFVGISLVLHPDGHILKWAALIGVLSGVLQGISNLAQRQVFAYQTTNQVLFYYYVVVVVFFGIVMPFYWHQPDFVQGVKLLGVAVFGWLFTTFYTIAFKYAPARYLAPFSLTSIVFAGLCDWLIWAQVPSVMVCVGAIIVIVGLVLIVLKKPSES